MPGTPYTQINDVLARAAALVALDPAYAERVDLARQVAAFLALRGFYTTYGDPGTVLADAQAVVAERVSGRAMADGEAGADSSPNSTT